MKISIYNINENINSLINGKVKWATSQINKVLNAIRYILKQIYTIYEEYLRNERSKIIEGFVTQIFRALKSVGWPK